MSIDWKSFSKMFMVVVATAVLAIILTSCGTSKTESVTFKVDTGDEVKVTLNTTDGYRLGQADGSWTVSNKDGEDILGCMWAGSDAAEEYRTILEQEGVEVEDVEISGCQGIKWCYEGQAGTEYNCIVNVTERTSLIIGSLSPESDQVYSLLTFTSK